MDEEEGGEVIRGRRKDWEEGKKKEEKGEEEQEKKDEKGRLGHYIALHICSPPTFHPHVDGSDHSKHQQKQNEDKALHVIGGHPLHAVQNSPEQLPLARIKAGSKHKPHTAIIWSTESG